MGGPGHIEFEVVFGFEEYLSQSNGNTDFLNDDEKYKFIDDVSILEILNLISFGLSSYNFHNHVASDIGIEHSYLDPHNIKSQEYLNKVSDWTDQNEMQLNCKKTKYMVFNYSKLYQFNTRLELENQLLEQVHQTKLLGLIIRDDLSWMPNTKLLTIKAYKRMIILKNLFHFDLPVEEMINIYCLYIRSVVEQCAVVWHRSLTKGEQHDLERVQKVALRIIMQENYSTYSDALKVTGLDTLKARRAKLCLNFAKGCIKNDVTSDIFSVNSSTANTRNHEKYYVYPAKTGRLANSAIPYMAGLLNSNVK